MSEVQLDPVEHYRMALSYLELVRQEFDKWKKIYDAHKVDRTYYDTVGASYQQHLDHANKLVTNIRSFHEARLPEAQRELKILQRGVQKNIKLFETEKLSPKKMNEAHRENQGAIEQLDDDIWVSGTIVHAQTTEVLGGRLDLTIGEYAKRLVPDTDLGTPELEKPKGVTRRQLLYVAGTAVVGAAGYAGYGYYSTLAKARFSADFSAGTKKFLRLSCENRGNETLFWYVPWPSGNPLAMDIRKNPMAAVGILLYVQQKGNESYQLLPESPGCWWSDKDEIEPGTRFAIRRGRRRTVVFDIEKLKALGIKPEAVKLTFTRHGGRSLHTFKSPIR